MQQNGILEAYILKFFPWKHALESPTRLHLQHLCVQLYHPKTSLFTWQGWNLWKAYSLVNHLNMNSSKGPQTSLASCHLLSVAMTSFRSAASLTLEPLMNIFSRRESYSFLAWKRNNWRLSKASTSESVNQNFRLARLLFCTIHKRHAK